jgi:hypothetical protein
MGRSRRLPLPLTVLSPSRITLENKGKIRPQPDRENAFARASGGGVGLKDNLLHRMSLIYMIMRAARAGPAETLLKSFRVPVSPSQSQTHHSLLARFWELKAANIADGDWPDRNNQ